MTLSDLIVYPLIAGGVVLGAVTHMLRLPRYADYADRYLGCPMYREYAASVSESARNPRSSRHARRDGGTHGPRRRRASMRQQDL